MSTKELKCFFHDVMLFASIVLMVSNIFEQSAWWAKLISKAVCLAGKAIGLAGKAIGLAGKAIGLAGKAIGLAGKAIGLAG